jgi:hypothetical protein
VDINFPSSEAFAGVRLLLSRITEGVRSLGETHEVGLVLPDTPRAPPRTLHVRRGPPPAQASLAKVAGWFAFGTDEGRRLPVRNFFEVDDGLREQITGDLIERFLADVQAGRTPPNRGALNLAMAYRFKAMVIDRWESGGGDLTVPPLSPQHLARKALLGYPATVGTMTGQTLAALRRAQPITRRKA